MFLPAKEDYTYAIKEMPLIIPKNQVLEAMDVHLKLAYVQRELGNLSEATEQYHLALAKMDAGAQVRHFAEAYWGLALIEFEQASKLSAIPNHPSTQRARLLQNALIYARKAKNLYESVEEMLNAVSVSCDIALIEQAAGNIDQARYYLQDIIDTWSPMLVIPPNTVTNQQRLQQYRNVVSAALCYLSSVELDAHLHSEALSHAQRSLEIARRSNALRHAEAAMNLGKILSSQESFSIKAEKAFKEAIDILTPTDFLAARVRAHNMLGHYLISHKRILEGKEELDKAYKASLKAQGIPL